MVIQDFQVDRCPNLNLLDYLCPEKMYSHYWTLMADHFLVGHLTEYLYLAGKWSTYFIEGIALLKQLDLMNVVA